MDASSQKLDWHYETLPQKTKKALDFLSKDEWIEKSGQKMSYHGEIPVMNLVDIAVMKITAVSQRGRKRDFFDLYWCAHNIESLENIIRRLPAQCAISISRSQLSSHLEKPRIF